MLLWYINFVWSIQNIWRASHLSSLSPVTDIFLLHGWLCQWLSDNIIISCSATTAQRFRSLVSLIKIWGLQWRPWPGYTARYTASSCKAIQSKNKGAFLDYSRSKQISPKPIQLSQITRVTFIRLDSVEGDCNLQTRPLINRDFHSSNRRRRINTN